MKLRTRSAAAPFLKDVVGGGFRLVCIGSFDRFR